MRYLDRFGYSITAEEWRALSRDPGYAVERTQVGPCIWVETAWVGVVLDHEADPDLFLVSIINRGPKDGGNDQGEERWCKTQEEANALHRKFVARFSRPQGKEARL